MKCELCENDATVFLTQIVEEKARRVMTQVNFCGKCAKEKGVTDPTGFQIADSLQEIADKRKRDKGEE
jgi:protein arginine kinase activator